MNHQKSEAFFSFYRKKEKLPLKLRLFLEQQNRFNVGYGDKKSLKPKLVYKTLNQSLAPTPTTVGRMSPTPALALLPTQV